MSLEDAWASLSGLSSGDVREIALALGWIAADHLRFIDGFAPGRATDLLEQLGLLVARMGD